MSVCLEGDGAPYFLLLLLCRRIGLIESETAVLGEWQVKRDYKKFVTSS